jgi:DNA-binding NarL/FixJ family response regulator
MIMRGLGRKQMADELHVSISTVRDCLERLYPKLGVQGMKEIPGLFGHWEMTLKWVKH